MSYQPSEDVKRAQKIIEHIEQKKQERATLVGELGKVDLGLRKGA